MNANSCATQATSPMTSGASSSRGCRRRTTSLREIVNAILSVLRTDCPWCMLPKDFPPLDHGVSLLRRVARQRAVGAREPSARGASAPCREAERMPVRGRRRQPIGEDNGESGGPRGYDAGKRVKGRKTPYRRRYREPAPCRAYSYRRWTGSRWRSRLAGVGAGDLAETAACFRRRRLRRPQTRSRTVQSRAVDNRDRQAFRHRVGLRTTAQALGSRAHAGVAQP